MANFLRPALPSFPSRREAEVGCGERLTCSAFTTLPIGTVSGRTGLVGTFSKPCNGPVAAAATAAVAVVAKH
jgi:hypothetical protein